MGAKLYDDALLEKLKNWTASTDLHIYGVEDSRRLFEVIADTHNDAPIKLPIICLRRNGGYEITNTNKKPMTFDGVMTESSIPKSFSLNAIPIKLNYRIDVYTRLFEEADEYMRNIVFNVINYPKLTVTMPYYDKKTQHNSTLTIDNEIEDNSDIPERLVSGQFTRLSANLIVDDAYLWDLRLRDNYTIDVDVKLEN